MSASQIVRRAVALDEPAALDGLPPPDGEDARPVFDAAIAVDVTATQSNKRVQGRGKGMRGSYRVRKDHSRERIEGAAVNAGGQEAASELSPKDAARHEGGFGVISADGPDGGEAHGDADR